HAPPRIGPALVTALLQHRYTANVRELDALLLRASMAEGGKYVDLTEGVRHAMSGASRASEPPESPARQSRAPRPGEGRRSTDASDVAESFTADEQRRLALQRKHRFKATACAADPNYGGNRQTADLHLRQLMSRALAIVGWDVDAAAATLAGDDAELGKKLR